MGFGFAPTVELFGRSIDTLLGALGSTLGFFGISTVEVFTKRGFANRLWALLPLVGLAGLVAVIEPVVRPVLPGVVGSLLRSPEAARPRVELVERRTNTSRALRTTLVRVCSGGPGVAATVRWEAIADGDDAVAGLGRGCLLVTENGSVQVASDDGRVPLDRPRTLHRGQSVEATYYFWISPKAGSRCALQIPEWSGGRVVAVPSLTFLFNEEAPGP